MLFYEENGDGECTLLGNSKYQRMLFLLLKKSLISHHLHSTEGTEVKQRPVIVPDLLIPEENRTV